jgi:hypothetical protein
MREEEDGNDDDDFFSDLEEVARRETEEILRPAPDRFINYRPKKEVVSKEEQAQADNHGKYLPPTLTHGKVVSDITEGAIRTITYEDGSMKIKVGGIWT